MTDLRWEVTLSGVDWLSTTMAIYVRCIRQAGGLAVRNWLMFAALLAYVFIFRFGLVVASFFGPLAGFAMAALCAFCCGAFLASVEVIVRTGKVTLEDFRGSFGTYFGDVLGVMFALWIIAMVGGMVAATPGGTAIATFSALLVGVLFNAVPELIYLGHNSTMELMSESYDFVSQNWIEWFPINILLALAGGGIWFVQVGGGFGYALEVVAGGIFIYFAMILRGLLFLELSSSSRRGRVFRHRAGE